VLGTQNGFYSTVMATAPGKYIGGGHTQGGEEKVLSVELLADGKIITPKIGTITAEHFLLRKVSMFDKLKFMSEITLTPEGIIESKNFIATADQPMHLMFIYLLCLNKDMTEWRAETGEGKIMSGKFDGDFTGKARWLLQKDIKWGAEYNSNSKQGVLLYYPKPSAGMGRRSSFWEVKNTYNKYYLMLKTPKSYAANYQSPTYTMVLKGFSSEKSELDKAINNAVTSASEMNIPKLKENRLKKVVLPKVKKVEKKAGDLQGAITFSADYTQSTSTNTTITAKIAKGDKNGKVFLAKKAVFDFDNMAHTIRGLAIGTKGSTVRYNSLGNLNPEKGSIELVVKADDWSWNDKKVHMFMTAIPRTKGAGKLYLYKYKTSGLAFYLERNKTGEKLFLNCRVKDWKDKSWHHIAVSYSPEAIVLYVDGVRRKAGQLGAIKEWASSFYVGPASKKFGYDGKSTVSLVNMYDRPLSAEEVKVLAKERLPDLKIDISLEEAALTGKKEIGKASPWFKKRPKLGMKALEDDTVMPPWSPVKYTKGKAAVWGREYKFSGKGIMDSINATNAELLKAPVALEIIANGKKQRLDFDAPEIVKQGKGRVVVKRQSTGGSISASIEYMIEFDGMVWNKLTIKPEKQKITEMKLIVPFTKENAKFIHYVGAPTAYESQDLIKNSFSRALGSQKGLLFKSGFKTNVWIGDNNRGLLWFAESEQNWWPKSRKNMVEVSRNSAGDVDLVLNMVSANLPYGKKSELLYKFGFMATPVKAMPKGWRGATFSAQYDAFKGIRRGTNLIYWPNEWRWMSLDPEPYRAIKVPFSQAKVKRDSGEKRKIIPYWTRLHYPSKYKEQINPDAIKVQNKWSTSPNRPGGGTHQMYRASCNSEWTDYLVWCVEEWGKLMGHIDGVYIDETQPIPNTKAISGGGYNDLKGVRRPTFEVFGSRNLIKRITYNIWKRNNETPSSVAHCSATHTMPTLSMYKMMLIGEQYYSGYFTNDPEFLPPNKEEYLYYYSYSLPMDRLRAECFSKQWGMMMVFLPCLKNYKHLMKHPTPARDLLSRIMQADMLVWPLFIDKREVYKTWDFRREFGIADDGVEFIPYWENKKIISNTKDVVVGYYKNGDKYLVIVSNLNRSAKTVKLNFSGIKVKSVKNAETNKDINKQSITIKRNDYIALRINY
jgi:Glycoside hydrolase 123, N-terminal domain/Concanavalin A-like lectin/glucanases superfamily